MRTAASLPRTFDIDVVNQYDIPPLKYCELTEYHNLILGLVVARTVAIWKRVCRFVPIFALAQRAAEMTGAPGTA